MDETQMLKSTDKNFKINVINILRNIQENMVIISYREF